jgi:polysaccharide biosynthesis/export protein
MRTSLILLIVIVVLLNMTACVSSKPIQYLQGGFDTSQLSTYELKEPVIQKGDLLGINVFSDNAEATALYNLPNIGGTEGDRSTAGYLVDNQGNIQFQGVGTIHVEGLNKAQLEELLNSKLLEVLKNPYYSIRFLNYKITVIGEVTKEGVYNIPNERINILEAIGLAGGLTVYARRENVTVIRHKTGKREFARLDLTNPESLKSPYFFLEQNDLIIVEQNKNKAAVSDQVTARNISLATSIISTLAIVYTVLFNR